MVVKVSVLVLTGGTLASNPEIHQQQGEQGQGEELHVQPRARSATSSWQLLLTRGRRELPASPPCSSV